MVGDHLGRSVVVNSSYLFSLGGGGNTFDLYSSMLDEAGNVFGGARQSFRHGLRHVYRIRWREDRHRRRGRHGHPVPVRRPGSEQDRRQHAWPNGTRGTATN